MAAEGNKYGYPHKKVLAALNDVGATVYGTDINGTIVIITNGTEYEITLGYRTTP